MPSDACDLSLSRPTRGLETNFSWTPVYVQPSFRARLEESQGNLRHLRDISLPIKTPVSSSRPLLARNLPQSNTENQRSFKISLTGHVGLDAVIVLIQLPSKQATRCTTWAARGSIWRTDRDLRGWLPTNSHLPLTLALPKWQGSAVHGLRRHRSFSLFLH